MGKVLLQSLAILALKVAEDCLNFHVIQIWSLTLNRCFLKTILKLLIASVCTIKIGSRCNCTVETRLSMRLIQTLRLPTIL